MGASSPVHGLRLGYNSTFPTIMAAAADVHYPSAPVPNSAYVAKVAHCPSAPIKNKKRLPAPCRCVVGSNCIITIPLLREDTCRYLLLPPMGYRWYHGNLCHDQNHLFYPRSLTFRIDQLNKIS